MTPARLRLLGPIEVVVDGTPRAVRGLRRRAVLAALALHPGEAVGANRLVDIVWGDTPPAAAVATLQSHLSQLRREMGHGASIVARVPGYQLDLGADRTDVQLAEELIEHGSRSQDPGRAVSLFRSAVELWRGGALEEITGLPWFVEKAERLEQLRQRARHGLIDARMKLGQHNEIIGELRDIVRHEPHHEQAHAQLMIAMYRAGRQGDALAIYQQLRRALDDDLGIRPSQTLRELETAILRQDPTLDEPMTRSNSSSEPVSGSRPRSSVLPIPAQLPLAPAGFAGRVAELAALDRLLAEPPSDQAAVTISAVSGTAGIGKTTLAVHWAHRVAARYPDGQLYVNLRGFDPTGAMLDPADALREFLDAFDVPADRIPAGLQARAVLYRSVLAGKRILVVLDNARNAEQVRPLLPGTAGCLAIVTSRNQLTGLVATEGAHPLTLDLLDEAEAHDLLTWRLGVDRTAAEPDALRSIVAHCARVPLALAIVAARAVSQPSFPLAAVAAALSRNATLDVLASGDPATDFRAVFSWSQQILTTDADRLFRLLALHPGTDIATPAVASLLATSTQHAHRHLTELTEAHLLTQYQPGRYTFHDLLRAYAREQTHTRDTNATREAASRRLLDHYLHTAFNGALQIFPMWDTVTFPPPQPGIAPQDLSTQDAALAWFAAEHAVIRSVIEWAVAGGFDTHAYQLAWAFAAYLLRRGYTDEQIAVQQLAVDAARRQRDRVGQGHALRALAMSHGRHGSSDTACALYQQALDIYIDVGDRTAQAHTFLGLAEVRDMQGQPAVALEHSEKSFALFRALGDRRGQAHALNGVGWCHAQLGHYEQAIAHCSEALILLKELDDRFGEAVTWDSLGHIHNNLADYTNATACYQRAIDLFQELGDRYYEADAVAILGDIHLAAGNRDEANKSWRVALDIFEVLDHPDVEKVRAKLAANG